MTGTVTPYYKLARFEFGWKLLEKGKKKIGHWLDFWLGPCLDLFQGLLCHI